MQPIAHRLIGYFNFSVEWPINFFIIFAAEITIIKAKTTMKRLFTLGLVLMATVTMIAQGWPAEYKGVMLQ